MPAAYRLITALFLCAVLASAQISSRITGSVIDQTGAAVPNAVVELVLPGGDRAAFSSTTSSEGLFSMIGVPAGTYALRVSASGFRKFSQQGVEMKPAIETSMPPIKLEVGATAETVEVRSEGAMVQATNAEISVNLTRQQVAALPSLNRSPQAFINTQAGISNGRNGVTILNGQRTSFTNVTIDGINIQDNFIRTNAADFSPNLLLLDQVAEMTVSTSNTNPSVGGGASQVAFVTRSGTNQFQGNVFWSNRNNAFASNTWFNNQAGRDANGKENNPRPFLNQNQAGGSFGGPIRRDKLFFYTNFEAFRLRQQAARNRTILTDDARNGIFTYQNASGAVTKVNVLQAMGFAADPTMAAIIKQLPSGSLINNTRVGDSTASLLRNTGGYSFNQRSNRDRNNLTGKVDYNLSAHNSISGTLLYNTDLLDRGDVNNLGYSLVPLVANDQAVLGSSVAWRWNPTAHITNEVRGGFNRAPALFISSETFGNTILNSALFDNPLNTFRSQGRYVNTYNFADNAAWNRGKLSSTLGS